MKAEIITIGDELLIGQVINTNQAYIAEKLNTVGIYTEHMTTVGDTAVDVMNAFQEAFARYDVVCVTGGLGPTHDDITKKVVCDFFQTDLVMDAQALSRIEDLMNRRGIKLSNSSRDQALVPRGCTVIPNDNGSAPGMMFEKEGKYFFVFPGVPFEMKGMVDDWVVPFFEKKKIGIFVRHRVLKTTGISESLLAQEVGNVDAVIGSDGTTTLAFLPNQFGARMRITVREKSIAAAQQKLDHAEAVIRSKVEKYIYSSDDTELEDVIGQLLHERTLTLSTAESCTGGLIANRITNIPGSSAYFVRGFVVYSNQAKIDELNVPSSIIERHGAVSKETAESMANGCRIVSHSDIALSVTGIAGPTGGSGDKPVGTAWIGYSDRQTTVALKFDFGNHRLRFKERASQAALELLRRKLMKI